MHLRLKIFWIILALINVTGYAVHKLNTSVAFNTEVMEQGKLVSKRSLVTQLSGVIKNDTFGLYTDWCIVSPLQYKELFPNRWVISGGVLKKVTDHFTFDFGAKYTFLQRLGFENLHQWMTYYLGVRSDLLMQPKFYLSWDPERHQWGLESSFKYDFDLSIFDCTGYKLSWETTFGFLRGRKPYGRHRVMKKYKCYYIETELLLRKYFGEAINFYIGPKFACNTGGTQSWTYINTATHRSQFCGLCFGLELSF